MTESLGYRGNPDWRDMSDFLVHFVGGRDASMDDRHTLLCTILESGRLVPGADGFGFTKGWKAPTHSSRAVCMSEVPLTYLARLVNRHGSFGIGLRKADVRELGGQRVWYVDANTELMAALDELRTVAVQNSRWSDPLWKVTRFIDAVMPGDDGGPRYEFEWEREWRVPGEVPVTAAHVPFLFVPQGWQSSPHLAATGIKMVDPTWPEDRMEAALAGISG